MLQHGDLDLVEQVAERLAQHGLDIVARGAGHRADVDVDVDDVGDHVGLLAAVHHVGRDGRVRDRVTHPGDGDRQLLRGWRRSCSVEVRPATDLVRQVHRGDLGTPDVVDVGGRSELGQSRRTISAALISALSAPNGIDP